VSIIEAARAFASEAHENQAYGELPYTYHLEAVANVLNEYAPSEAGVYERLMCAAWLHDVIEDTDTTRDHVQAHFGHSVAHLVWACTGEGENRKERNASIYAKIRQYPLAAIVKLADRIANVEHSAPGSKHRLMYAKEMPAFEEVIRPFVPPSMWARLEVAIIAH
jgi:(p)ppGpp synthase/HD superfamily hydrolase